MDADVVADLFASFGPVTLKRLFGGAGLYADGLMFAIAVRDVIYLKADAALAAELEGRGSAPFSYVAKGAVRTMSGFWSVPEAALDDGEDLALLARRALAVARAAAARRLAAKKARAGEANMGKLSAGAAGAPSRGKPRAKKTPGKTAPQ